MTNRHANKINMLINKQKLWSVWNFGNVHDMTTTKLLRQI